MVTVSSYGCIMSGTGIILKFCTEVIPENTGTSTLRALKKPSAVTLTSKRLYGLSIADGDCECTSSGTGRLNFCAVPFSLVSPDASIIRFPSMTAVTITVAPTTAADSSPVRTLTRIYPTELPRLSSEAYSGGSLSTGSSELPSISNPDRSGSG